MKDLIRLDGPTEVIFKGYYFPLLTETREKPPLPHLPNYIYSNLTFYEKLGCLLKFIKNSTEGITNIFMLSYCQS